MHLKRARVSSDGNKRVVSQGSYILLESIVYYTALAAEQSLLGALLVKEAY